MKMEHGKDTYHVHGQCNWQVEGVIGRLVLDNSLVPAGREQLRYATAAMYVVQEDSSKVPLGPRAPTNSTS